VSRAQQTSLCAATAPQPGRKYKTARHGTSGTRSDPTVSTGVVGYGNQVLIKRVRVFSALLRMIRKHGRSRLSIPLLGRLGCSRPHSCLQSSGVLGSASAHHKARAFSTLFLLTELGRSRPYSCLQSSGVLGSASAHHKARAFSALFLLTELGCSRLCLR